MTTVSGSVSGSSAAQPEQPLETMVVDPVVEQVVERSEQPLDQTLEASEVDRLQHQQQQQEQQQGPLAQCETPCPCCYYRISTLDEQGEYTTGWRKFGGRFVWFHKRAPHARPWSAVPGVLADSGVNDASVPRCACC